ncbi:MAG: lysylphosphatidylglycerol synthase transmembrane domain-containing protein [Chloroflexota bacterium]
MTPPQKNIWPYVFTSVKVAVGLVLLWFSLQQAQWARIAESITQVNMLWLALTFFYVLCGLALKVWRWARMLRYVGVPLPVSLTSQAFLAGQALNILLPARGGEWGRLGLILAEQSGKSAEVGMTIVLEKVIDLAMLGICATFVSVYLPSDILYWLLPIGGLLIFLMFVFTLWGEMMWNRFKNHLEYIRGSGIKKVVEFTDQVFIAGKWIRNTKQTGYIFFITLLVWLIMWGTNLTLFRAMGISLGAEAALLVLVLVYIGMLPALMPGNIGPFYFFAQLALRPFQVGDQEAVAYSVLLHALVTLPPLVGGGISLLLSRRPGKKTRREHYE